MNKLENLLPLVGLIFIVLIIMIIFLFHKKRIKSIGSIYDPTIFKLNINSWEIRALNKNIIISQKDSVSINDFFQLIDFQEKAKIMFFLRSHSLDILDQTEIKVKTTVNNREYSFYMHFKKGKTKGRVFLFLRPVLDYAIKYNDSINLFDKLSKLKNNPFSPTTRQKIWNNFFRKTNTIPINCLILDLRINENFRYIYSANFVKNILYLFCKKLSHVFEGNIVINIGEGKFAIISRGNRLKKIIKKTQTLVEQNGTFIKLEFGYIAFTVKNIKKKNGLSWMEKTINELSTIVAVENINKTTFHIDNPSSEISIIRKWKKTKEKLLSEVKNMDNFNIVKSSFSWNSKEKTYWISNDVCDKKSYWKNMDIIFKDEKILRDYTQNILKFLEGKKSSKHTIIIKMPIIFGRKEIEKCIDLLISRRIKFSVAFIETEEFSESKFLNIASALTSRRIAYGVSNITRIDEDDCIFGNNNLNFVSIESDNVKKCLTDPYARADIQNFVLYCIRKRIKIFIIGSLDKKITTFAEYIPSHIYVREKKLFL